jgi:hypothetical protein
VRPFTDQDRAQRTRAHEKLTAAFGPHSNYEEVPGWMVAGEPHEDAHDLEFDSHVGMRRSVWILDEDGHLSVVLRLFGDGVGNWEEMGYGHTSYFECAPYEGVEIMIAQARFHASRLIEGYTMPTRPRRENPLRGRLQNHTPEWYAKLRRIREDRLARGGEPAYEAAYAARDAAASHRLSLPDCCCFRTLDGPVSRTWAREKAGTDTAARRKR